jgi:succinyl-diaminopimelate desuccinylase
LIEDTGSKKKMESGLAEAERPEGNNISGGNADPFADCGHIARIEAQQDEMICTLRELIAIKSVAGEEEGDAPFGAGVQAALDYMLRLAERDGFSTENADNFGGHIEFGGDILNEAGETTDAREIMGILGHLDVVPEGREWERDPYGGEVADGRIYGRGSSDDKGPVVAVYYAMKALRDCGFSPEKKVRLILGLDEESGCRGMERYLEKAGRPDFGFTPDADFPVIHGEKGILTFELAKKIRKNDAKGVILRSFSGGSAANMTPDFAKAVIRADSYGGIREAAAEFCRETGYRVYVKGAGKSLEITAAGVSAHGASPEKGLNAISVLMALLSEIGFANEDVKDFIGFYNEHIGFELNGESMGCALFDEQSGSLIFNVGTVRMDDGAVILTVNVRYPVTMDQERVYEAITPVINKYDLGIIKLLHMPPVYVPKDDPLVRSLTEVYRKHSGDSESEPLVIGGGTYARMVKNTVAFGAAFPGEPETAHQKNEYISIDNLIKIAKIYADAIRVLAGRLH